MVRGRLRNVVNILLSVPRTRSAHKLAAAWNANFGFKSGTKGIKLLVSLSIPEFVRERW